MTEMLVPISRALMMREYSIVAEAHTRGLSPTTRILQWDSAELAYLDRPFPLPVGTVIKNLQGLATRSVLESWLFFNPVEQDCQVTLFVSGSGATGPAPSGGPQTFRPLRTRIVQDDGVAVGYVDQPFIPAKEAYVIGGFPFRDGLAAGRCLGMSLDFGGGLDIDVDLIVVPESIGP